MQPALLAKEIIHTGKAHRLVTVDSAHPQVHVLTGSVEGFSQHTTQQTFIFKGYHSSQRRMAGTDLGRCWMSVSSLGKDRFY